MLNIGRMAPSGAEYYLTVVADRDATDHYLARGEEPGRWLGRGTATLGLDGRVDAEPLRAVLAAKHPATSESLASHPARKVPGFDLTFRAPKSVSLLWALGEPQLAAAATAAHDAAVDAAVGYLEPAAGFTRRGAGGTETVAVEGFVAAAFRHRTSRANDPLLHTHVLIANLARTTDDGQWRTLDSRKLFAHAKTAGFLYQAQLRHELTVRLGIVWQPVSNGTADIAGVDREIIEAFSRRRTAIVQHMATRGETSAAAAQVATLATRQAKDGHRSEAELRADWRTRARTLGMRTSWARDLTGHGASRPPDADRLYRDLVLDEGLTDQSSSFSRRDVIRAVAERLPTGAPVIDIEQFADTVIARDPHRVIALGPTRGQLTGLDVIRRDDGRIVPAAPEEPRYTTRGLLLTEQRATNQSLRRLDAALATVAPAGVDRVLKDRKLTDEQAAMVRQLTGTGHGVEVVVGKAGTGKTYALDAARDAWQTSGIRVTGVALAARAALELQASAGIRSITLARLLDQLERDAPDVLQPGSVLVVDEAGMIGTRQLARLLDHAEKRQVKVVLVGDPHQLPEIDAGGLFRTLSSRLPAIELTDNRRQAHAWEQAALDELRDGDPDVAIVAYRRHGRIVTADTPDALRERLVADWWDTHRQPDTRAIMVALRRADVDDLNRRARTHMLTAGRLTGPSLRIGDTELQAGDRIVCLRNSQRHGVTNGTRATITHLDRARRRVHAIDDHGVHLQLSAEYLDAGHVTHGYAITGHKAQGITVDHTFVLGSPELYREWGYVSMSRGRRSNRLYLTPGEVPEDLHPRTLQPELEPTDAVTGRLRRSRAHHTLVEELADIAHRWRAAHVRLAAPDIARQRALALRRAELDRDRHATIEQLARLERRIERASSGLGRLRNRQQLAELHLDHRTRSRWLPHLEQQLGALDAELATLPTEAQMADLLAGYDRDTRQLRLAARHRVTAFRHDRPGYLTSALGTPPRAGPDRDRWEHTAHQIEEYRLRWGVTDPHQPLGSRPATDIQRSDRDRVASTLGRYRQLRHADSRHPPLRGLSR